MQAQSNLVAVVLAAGRGTRLRSHQSGAVTLRRDQDAAAATGVKALMPIHTVRDGRASSTPFIAFTLEAMAQAGVRRVCFVVRPGLRHPERRFPTHPAIEVSFAEQQAPRGTAHAVASAREVVADNDLLVLNSDTFYPTEAISQLIRVGGPALLALDGHRVAADPASNLTAHQMAQWAAVAVDQGHELGAVLDPPRHPPANDKQGPTWWVNVNAWRFDHRIFEACRRLEEQHTAQPGTKRDTELELPHAVELSRRYGGVRYRVVPSTAPLLDLTSRSDIGSIQRLLPALPDGRSATTDL